VEGPCALGVERAVTAKSLRGSTSLSSSPGWSSGGGGAILLIMINPPKTIELQTAVYV